MGTLLKATSSCPTSFSHLYPAEKVVFSFPRASLGSHWEIRQQDDVAKPCIGIACLSPPPLYILWAKSSSCLWWGPKQQEVIAKEEATWDGRKNLKINIFIYCAEKILHVWSIFLSCSFSHPQNYELWSFPRLGHLWKKTCIWSRFVLKLIMTFKSLFRQDVLGKTWSEILSKLQLTIPLWS